MAMQTKSGHSGAGDATKHWWTLRLTAVALIPLAVWFVVSLVALAGADYPTMIAWVSNPFVTVLMLTMIVALFYHLRLGLQDMVEDYVHARPAKVVLSAVLTYGCFLLAMAAIAAVLKIAIAS